MGEPSDAGKATPSPSTAVMSLGSIRALMSEAGKKTLNTVEGELALCAGCRGECRKEANRHMRPQMQPDGTITLTACEHGRQRRIPYADKTFGDYQTTADNATAKRIAKWYLAGKTGKSLYIYGETGTGKTFLASLTARHFEDLIFGDVPSLLDEVKRTFNGNGDSREIIARYSQCAMLVLDDLGAGQVTEWSVGIIYQIINNRYTGQKRMIVTSNFDFDGLQRRLTVNGDIFTAKRIVSRLSEMCVKVFLGTEDRRKEV